jgi:GNAT superfamily N-acetyltransferase
VRYVVHRDPRYFLNRGAEEVGSMRVSAEVASFFLRQNLGPSQYTVTAYDGDQAVGFFRLAVRGHLADALGTFVAASHRRRGVATTLWQHAIKELDLKRVRAMAITAAGHAFLSHLATAEETADVFLDGAERD